jgi:predicted  nucleic acid-binding Zn-ribbon protein
VAVLQRQQRLKELNETIRERREYLEQTERNIEVMTIAAADSMRELQGDIDELENEKLRLMKQLFGLEQRIREAKTIVQAWE